MKKQARNQKSDAELLPQEKTSNNGGSPNRQERVPVPTVADVKERIAADRKRGPERPLRSLAGAEEALKLHSSAMTKISDTKKKRPDPNLVVHQLTRALDTSGASMTIAPKLREETVALYRALETDDPISSVLGRVFVVTNNSVMAAYERKLRRKLPCPGGESEACRKRREAFNRSRRSPHQSRWLEKHYGWNRDC